MSEIPRPSSAQPQLPSQIAPTKASTSTTSSNALDNSVQLEQVRRKLKEKQDAIEKEKQKKSEQQKTKDTIKGIRDERVSSAPTAIVETPEQRFEKSMARRAGRKEEGKREGTNAEASGLRARHNVASEGRVRTSRTFVLTAQDLLNFQKIPPSTPNTAERTQSDSAIPPDDVEIRIRLRELLASPPRATNVQQPPIEQQRDQTIFSTYWHRIWAFGERYFRQEVLDGFIEGVKLQLVESGQAIQVAAEKIWWGFKDFLLEIGIAILSAFALILNVISALTCSAWSIWVFRGIYKTVIHYVIFFYACVSVLYFVLAVYRSYTGSIPGIGFITGGVSAPVVFITCQVPGVRMVDDSFSSLCPPIVPKVDPASSYSSREGGRGRGRGGGGRGAPRSKQPDTTEILYEFAALSTPEFWEKSLKLSGHLADLSTSFNALRNPYERLYGKWKYTVSPVLRARRRPAVMPLLGVVESIDAVSHDLILLESKTVSAWIRVETTMGFFRERLAAEAARSSSWFQAPSLFGSKRKRTDMLLAEYAYQCEIIIEQITLLIKFIKSVILLFRQLGDQLDNLRVAILMVEESRQRDMDTQWFWVRFWRTSDFSAIKTGFGLLPLMGIDYDSAAAGGTGKDIAVRESFYLETLQIVAITRTNEQTMEELSTMLNFLTKKQITWNQFKRGLYAYPEPTEEEDFLSARSRDEDEDDELSSEEEEAEESKSESSAGDGSGASGRRRERVPGGGGDREINLELHIKMIDQMWEQYKRSSQLAWSDLIQGRRRARGESGGGYRGEVVDVKGVDDTSD